MAVFFFYCCITSILALPVKIKPNVMVRILLKSVLGFQSPAGRAPKEYTEYTKISKQIPTDLSEDKILSCMLFYTLENYFIGKDPHLTTSSYKSELSTSCSSCNLTGAYYQPHLLHSVYLWKKYYYL